MSYTALVLDSRSRDTAVNRARGRKGIGEGWREIAHHVTLAMGDKRAKFKAGTRRLVATHFGTLEGRVCAFRVSGADDSENAIPHVTVAVAPGAKPVESNQITNWQELGAEEIFPLVGKLEVC